MGAGVLLEACVKTQDLDLQRPELVIMRSVRMMMIETMTTENMTITDHSQLKVVTLTKDGLTGARIQEVMEEYQTRK